MTMWDFFHAHAEGIGALVFTAMALVFLIWFIKEMNRD